MAYSEEDEERNKDLNKDKSLEEVCKEHGFDPDDKEEWKEFINKWYEGELDE